MRKKQRKEREKAEKEEARKSSSSDSDSKKVPSAPSTQDDCESRDESGKVEETKEPGKSKAALSDERAAKSGSSDSRARRGKGSSNRQKTSEKSQAESGIQEMLLAMLCFDLSIGVILMEARSMLLSCLCV